MPDHETIDRPRLKSLMQREQKKFVDERPKSKALFERAGKSLLGGVPMNWMVKWAGAFPPFVREAQGAHFYDVDGHRYIDLLPGRHRRHDRPFSLRHGQGGRRADTARHHADAAQRRLRSSSREELQQRFGLPLLAIRADRHRCQPFLHPPGAPHHADVRRFWFSTGAITAPWTKVSSLCRTASRKARRGNIGPPVDPAVTTKVVEFNDLAALEQALEARRRRLRAGRAGA